MVTLGRRVGGLVPVATVFGPFHRDPVEAVTRELRAAIEGAADYCAIHEVRARLLAPPAAAAEPALAPVPVGHVHVAVARRG